MKFKKSLALLLVFAMTFAPVTVGAAELSNDETELEILGEDAAYVEDEVEVDENNIDVGADYWVHKFGWTKKLEDTTATAGKKITLSVKINDTAVKTITDPNTYPTGENEYISQLKVCDFSYDWVVTDYDGNQVFFADTAENGVTDTVEFTLEKPGKYDVMVSTNPTFNYGSTPTYRCSATITVVEGIPVTGVTVSPATAELKVGDTKQLKATVAPDNATNKDVTWKSSNDKVAKVDAKGVVTAVKEGTADITATSNDNDKAVGTCKVTVKAAETKVTKITLSPSKYVGKKNETFKIKVTITPSKATNKEVKFATSDKNVATVDKDGKVKIVGKSGKATITATAQDGSKVKGTCTVRVGTKVKTVKISAKDTKVKVGKTLKLSATVTPDNATEKGVTWKSSNKNIATVTSNGVVKGIKAGTVKITATAKDGSGKSASVTIKVEKAKVKVKKIRLNKTSKTLKSKDTYKFVATVEPSNATNKKLKWTSSNKNIASVDKNGKVTAHKTGKVTITATATDGSNVSAKATVKVPGLKLEPNKVSVKAGKSVVVKIKTTYDSVKSLTAEGESAYAALDKGGKTITVYGVKKGTTKIRVKTKAGIVKTLTVEVTGKSKTGSKIK